MFRHICFAAAALLCLTILPAAAADCSQHESWGIPTVTDGAKTVSVCHAGYASALDPATREIRWVAYDLTGPHTLGCFPRTGLSFKMDALAPPEDQGKPSDYSKSGYDLGHMAPNEDFAWDKGEQRDSFSMANVAPQLPGLNRQGWERLEEDVRAWARTGGDVEVYVGPLASSKGTIGKDKLPIPAGFFKVVVDRKTGDVAAFIMPQKAIAKGDAQPWLVTVADVQQQAHIKLPLPSNAKPITTAWAADLAGWRKAHAAACAK